MPELYGGLVFPKNIFSCVALICKKFFYRNNAPKSHLINFLNEINVLEQSQCGMSQENCENSRILLKEVNVSHLELNLAPSDHNKRKITHKKIKGKRLRSSNKYSLGTRKLLSGSNPQQYTPDLSQTL